MSMVEQSFRRGRAVNAMVFGLTCWLPLLVGCGKSTNVAPASTSPTRSELMVAAASDLKFALGDIAAAFEAKQKGVKVNATFGSSGNFYAQLVNHAPFDLFLSADASYPRQLIEQGLAEETTMFTYAVGQLVVWVPIRSPLHEESLGIEVLKDASIKTIAIANPRHAPYGRAAEAALKTLGIYDQIADKLVLGENLAQTLLFIESGAADVGIISLSFALAPEMREKGRYWVVPPSAYPRLEQCGIIVNWAREPAIATEFKRFLTGPAGRSILETHGFHLPKLE